jgi:lipopolysaccharide transport system ATP-binding protein
MTVLNQARPAIRFDRVAKRFPLDSARERSLFELFRRPFLKRPAKEHYWPLHDVSFEVPWGAMVGIVGENGSGKSTILKLIARILDPTYGTVEVNGRVSALLELGAGFHPELSGRENVFLAASLANVSRSQMKNELDSVIDFAEIGPYIDAPVKHYSSGMFVRLGFAVAVHLHPQILLIDEVLAVGDENFQHKCLERIEQLRQDGTTVVLVTHGMEQIVQMCEMAFWLHDGRICSIGEPRAVIADYLSAAAAAEQASRMARLSIDAPVPESANHTNGRIAGEPASVVPGEPDGSSTTDDGPKPKEHHPRGAPTPDARRWGDGATTISSVRVLDGHSRPGGTYSPDELIRIEFDYTQERPAPHQLVFGIAIYRLDGLWCYGTNTELDQAGFGGPETPLTGQVGIEIPCLRLLEGEYTIDIAVHGPAGEPVHDYIREAARFTVRNRRGDQGVFRPDLRWSLQSVKEKDVS